MTSKWSIFEKPYLDDDSPRSMNFHFNPNWPTIPEFDGVGPPGEGLWIFRWDRGMCWVSATGNYECGEDNTLRVSVGLVPPGHGVSYSYSAYVIQGDVTITNIEPHKGLSATIHFTSGANYDGPATICAGANVSGQLLQEVVVKSPFTGSTGILQWQRALALPPVFQVSTTYYEGINYDCGCQDFNIVCCNDTLMEYDEASSTGSMARDASGTIYITDSGRGNPYTYNIVGAGFWLDPYYTITTISSNKKYAMVYTDDTACGKATVTVTGCGGNNVSGEIMCTEGQWEPTDTHLECLVYYSPSPLLVNDNCIRGSKKYKIWICCYDCHALGYCDGHECEGWDIEYLLCMNDCETGTEKPCHQVDCWAAGKVTYGNWIC